MIHVRGPYAAAKDSGVLARIERMGMGVLSPEQGIAALAGVLGSVANIAATPFAWDRLSAVLKPAPEMCADLIVHPTPAQKTPGKKHKGGSRSRGARRTSSGGGGGGGKKRSGGDKGDSGPSLPIVQERVVAIISGVVGRDVEADEPLMDAGLDSLSGAELKSQVEAGIPLLYSLDLSTF